MEDAYLDSDPVKKQVLHTLEYIFTALFTAEMILKWIGLGPTKYFTNVWCLLDCCIVAVSELCLLPIVKYYFCANEKLITFDYRVVEAYL